MSNQTVDATTGVVKIEHVIVGARAVAKSSAVVAKPAAIPATETPRLFQHKVADRYKIKPSCMDDAVYILITSDVDNGVKRPAEVFLATQNHSQEWLALVSRLITAQLRAGVPLSLAADELCQRSSQRGGYISEGKAYRSVAHHIGSVLKHHIGEITNEKPSGGGTPSDTQARTICPHCGSESYVISGTCGICTECDYSSCG